MSHCTSMSITVICPTRGRPDGALELWETFKGTAALPETDLFFVIDEDDPEHDGYVAAGIPWVSVEHAGGGMAAPLNAAIPRFSPYCAITGFVGDDHRFRTFGWDVEIERVMKEAPGLAYANDLIRSDIPTQVFIDSRIVLALGWMCLPGAKHLYLDDTWRRLGEGLGRLHYLPDVVIEHCHPTVGTAKMDAGYARVNHPTMYQHDSFVFGAWLDSGRAAKDIEIARQAVGA